MNQPQPARNRKASFYVVLAAVLYGISMAASKLFLESVSSILMAALLYLGAGVGMFDVLLSWIFLREPIRPLFLLA